ncbi:hypothetical protein [Rubinisphaera brasiliensis]|uniref:Uncharacterized protein n=1 Tax=Rubinisphaera brasiliensis (strain ATCC 49424 / DSM 5305 / JCM 21570 / IAM 15109 / NBRC 103401 / IFAM 1448) TaxID=756272 RepID=F0SHL6_RUBBR|nr:hypothetical protein [Rubinisphaera brasiliensis]ADY58454.1 hypothetical protein Plabr_0831 [Rubinisphaera brasiliensis DSM 5305]
MSSADNPQSPASNNEAEIACAEVLAKGTWERMDGDQVRWVWKGDRNVSPRDLLGEQADLQLFPSVSGSGSIAICVLDDGGLVSYEREAGQWLHTLNGVSAFRYKVYELNVVPIEELGKLLKRTDELAVFTEGPAASGEAAETASGAAENPDEQEN